MLIWQVEVEDKETHEIALRTHLGENENEVRRKIEDEYPDRNLEFVNFECHGQWLSEEHGGPILDDLETHTFQ